MKLSIGILCVFMMASCNWHGDKNTTGDGHFSKTYLLQKGIIVKLAAANHRKLAHISGNFDSFKKYLSGLKDTRAESIPYALDYIKTCLPANLPERDSVLLLFRVNGQKVG